MSDETNDADNAATAVEKTESEVIAEITKPKEEKK